MTNYLVTGATGYIGKRLVDYLVKNKNDSIVALSKSKNNLQSYTNLKNVNCDLVKSKVPDSYFEDIDVIIHLAGYAHDLSNNKNNHYYELLNVDASIKIAAQAIKHKTKKFIFISSVKAGFKNNSTDENILDIYGKSKRNAELKLLGLFKDTNIHFSILRPALVYGPNPKGNLGSMIQAIKKGWFPPLPKIKNRRSLVHVDDVIKAIFFLLDNKAANKEIFILTDNRNYSTYEIYEIFCKLLDKKIPYLRVPFFIFKFISVIYYPYSHIVKKLFDDEYYDSTKIRNLGYKNNFYLEDMNAKTI